MIQAIESIRRSVVVAVPRERAFEVFTRETGTWWPFEKHSIGEAKVTDVVFDVADARWRVRVRTTTGADLLQLTCRAGRDNPVPAHEVLTLEPVQ